MSYAMKGARPAWGMRGIGQDAASQDCPPGKHWDDSSQKCICGEDSIEVDGVCKDQSTMCGPGTQWVDADKACVPITKYMSPAQIAAAVKANVPAVLLATTGSATPRTVAVAARPAAAAAPQHGMFASLFGGPNAKWILGGLAVGALGLAVLSRGHKGRTEPRRAA